jgi:hypothetical protein
MAVLTSRSEAFMKVAIVFFKGLDGCGVQRFGEIMREWLVEQGAQCDIFYFNKKFFRAGVQSYKAYPFDEETVDEISKKWNDYDIVLVNSYCGRRSSLIEISACLTAFEKNVTKPIKAGMMHEITLMNANMIPALPLWMGLMDQIITFDTHIDVAVRMKTLMPRLRVYDYTLPFNDTEIERLSNLSSSVPFSEKQNKLVYAGRWTTMKEPSRLFKFKRAQLDTGKFPDLDLLMIGLERSLGCKQDILDDPLFNNLIATNNKFSEILQDRHSPGLVAGYGMYTRDLLFNTVLSKVKYACSFYRLTDKNANNYGNRMEYSMIEMSCLTVPVFDEHWGLNNRLRSSGLTETFHQQNAAVFSNPKNIEKTLDELQNLAEDEQKFIGYRQRAIDSVKREFAASHVIPAFFTRILSEGKLPQHYTQKEIAQTLNFNDASKPIPCVSFAELGKNEKFEWRVGSNGRLNADKVPRIKPGLLF